MPILSQIKFSKNKGSSRTANCVAISLGLHVLGMQVNTSIRLDIAMLLDREAEASISQNNQINGSLIQNSRSKTADQLSSHCLRSLMKTQIRLSTVLVKVKDSHALLQLSHAILDRGFQSNLISEMEVQHLRQKTKTPL